MVSTSGSVGGLLDEPLDRRRERLVRVVDEDVARADRREYVGRLVVDRATSRGGMTGVHAGLGLGCPGRRSVERRQVEHARDLVDVGRSRPMPRISRPRGGGHRALDLEPDCFAEAAPPELLLDRHQQVVGLVLLDLEVRVPVTRKRWFPRRPPCP